jgi:hypothetical protein
MSESLTIDDLLGRWYRLDGAFRPWLDRLISALLERCPVPDGSATRTADDLPAPRVLLNSIGDNDECSISVGSDPTLDPGALYHEATLICNRRITAEDWYQDVRHFEFTFQDDIRQVNFEVISAISTRSCLEY